MKFPKKTKRYCPYCKKHTEQKIEVMSTGHKRGSLKRGSKQRAALRGRARGLGNMGRWSKPAVKSWKRKTKSTTRKVLVYTCQQCRKSAQSKKSRRVSKLTIESESK